MIRTTVLPHSLRFGLLVVEVDTHEAWRDAARRLLTKRVPPEAVHWLDRSGERQLLLGMPEGTVRTELELSLPGRLPPRFTRTGRGGPAAEAEQAIRVPKRFTELARIVARHRDSDRWDILYRVLWRLTHGERTLLEFATDDEVRVLSQMEHDVRSDLERMKSAIRFRRVGSAAEGHYVAWHKPAHRVLEWVVPFFRRRFGVMRWSVFTPDASVH